MSSASNSSTNHDSQPESIKASDKQRFFVQAPIPALRQDGLGSFALGTVIFLALAVAGFMWRDRLSAAGHGWWIWVAVSGVCIGVIAIFYGISRRRRLGQTHTGSGAEDPS